MDKDFQVRLDEMLKKVHLEPYEEPEPKPSCFEISIEYDNEEGEFYHEGYYNTVEEAIKALEKYKTK